MPLQIVRNDVTRMNVDAIVNAANEHLAQGGGVCGAIFAAAGERKMRQACSKIGHCDTGSSVATPGFKLPAKHVIHAVGPVWQGGSHKERDLLASCYQSALELALELGDASIAFPLISSGVYGYPKNEAIDVALDAIRLFLQDHEMDVYLVLFDPESLRAGNGRFAGIAHYIDDQYVRKSPYLRRSRWEQESLGTFGAPNLSAVIDKEAPIREEPAPSLAPGMPTAAPSPQAAPSPVAASKPRKTGTAPQQGVLRSLLNNLDASFSATLLSMIDERGYKDSEVYKRANMSRQHFSKIRSNQQYQPKKQTVLALAIALELTLDETRLLLERAGFALSHADERDIIVEYFIGLGNYDIYEINLALYAFDQPLLG